MKRKKETPKQRLLRILRPRHKGENLKALTIRELNQLLRQDNGWPKSLTDEEWKAIQEYNRSLLEDYDCSNDV